MSGTEIFPHYAGVPFENLVVPGVVTPGFGPGERRDPFWSMVWANSHGGPVINWRSSRMDRELRDADIGTTASRQHWAKGSPRTVEDAREILPRRRPRVEALATINLWREITGEQLAAMCANPSLASSDRDDVSVLYDAGFIQRGRFAYNGSLLRDHAEIFRPEPDAPVQIPEMTYADWLSVTLGGEPIRGHQYDRHNLLATELSLRVAEMCPIRSVLGESAATWPRLFHPSLSPNPYRAADAVWLREDGLTIIVEMVATAVVATMQRKIDQLTDLLARDTTKSSAVLFVVAADQRHDRSGDVARAVRRIVKQSVRSSMSRVLADVPKRVAVARWEDWFPGPGLASREFIGLRAWRCLDGTSWSEADLLDPYYFPFALFDAPEVAQTLDNVALVLGAPHWLRKRSTRGDEFDDDVLDHAGFPDVLKPLLKSPRRGSSRGSR